MRGSALIVERAEHAVQKGSRDARELVGDRAIAAAATPDAQRKLRALRSALEPAPRPLDLARATGNRVYLSDAAWVEAKVGWGKVNVAGVKQLELWADGAEGHNHHSWAIWADPELER